MAGATDELNFKIFIFLINLNLNSHMGLVATTLDSAVLTYPSPHSSWSYLWPTSQTDITVAPETKWVVTLYLTIFKMVYFIHG